MRSWSRGYFLSGSEGLQNPQSPVSGSLGISLSLFPRKYYAGLCGQSFPSQKTPTQDYLTPTETKGGWGEARALG